jgi:hypothetical protein
MLRLSLLLLVVTWVIALVRLLASADAAAAQPTRIRVRRRRLAA